MRRRLEPFLHILACTSFSVLFMGIVYERFYIEFLSINVDWNIGCYEEAAKNVGYLQVIKLAKCRHNGCYGF